MTKKEYILAVIDTFPDWEMWRWIKAMVQNDQLDEHTINMLVIIFKKAMDKITATIKKSKEKISWTIRENKMIETIQAVENFDKQKPEQAKQDAKSLEELDSKLNDF